MAQIDDLKTKMDEKLKTMTDKYRPVDVIKDATDANLGRCNHLTDQLNATNIQINRYEDE